MALEIVGVERKVSVGPNPGMKFMAKLKKGRKVPMSQIYKDITDLSSLSRGDIKNTVDNLWLVIGKYLADGRDVDLGEFGEFKISISAKAVDTLEEVTAETIRRPKITFYMGKELRKLLKDTQKVLGSLDMKGYKSRKSNEQENP